MQSLKTISACSACLYSLGGYPSGRPFRAYFAFLLQNSMISDLKLKSLHPQKAGQALLPNEACVY